MRLVSPFSVLATDWESPEGPAFDRHGALFFVSSERGAVVRVHPTGSAAEFVNTGGLPAGLAFHPDGTLLVADSGPTRHGLLAVTPGGDFAVVADHFGGVPFNGCNDLVFAPDGALYFSDPWRTSLANPAGGFYRLVPDGRVERIDHWLAFPNGVAVAPDASAVFLAETYTNRIYRYRLSPAGTVGARELFAEVAGGLGPDGMAFDVEGTLYVAHYDAGRIDLIEPAGRVVGALPVPGAQPTNVAFGGPDRRTLVVTENATRSVYRAEVAVPGQPLYGDVANPPPTPVSPIGSLPPRPRAGEGAGG